jgi:O-antigen/teichoic acid export membrane protein
VVGVAVDLGMSSLVIRDVSSDPERAPGLLGTVLKTQALAAVAVVGVAIGLAFAAIIPGPASAVALALAFGVTLASIASRAFEATLTGRGRAPSVAVARIARGVALLAGTALVVIVHPGIETFLLAGIGAELVGTATAGVLCLRATRPLFTGPVGELRTLLLRALPFALLAGFNLVYARIDLVMLGLLSTKSAVANYGVASRLLETAIVVPAYFGSAFLATVAQGALSPVLTGVRTARAIRYILIVCVPLAFGLAIAGDPLVRLFAGRAYSPAGTILALLSPILVLVASYGVLSNLQIAIDRTATLVKINLAGVVVKVALNLYAIPAYGAKGAAVAAVVAEAAVVVAQWSTARSQVSLPDFAGWCGKLALCAAAMIGAGALVLAAASWALALVAGLAVFAAAAWLSHCMSPHELRAAWSSLGVRAS